MLHKLSTLYIRCLLRSCYIVMLQVVDGELTNNSDSGRVAGGDEGQARVL